jgi:hypothetical protein
MLPVHYNLDQQKILTLLYAPYASADQLVQLAIKRIDRSSTTSTNKEFANKARYWKSVKPESLIPEANENELLSTITDLLDSYTCKFDSIPEDEQKLIDLLRLDFSSRTLHEILHRFLLCKEYEFSSINSPLLHGDNSILKLLFLSGATQKLLNKEVENPLAILEKQLQQGAIKRNEMLRILVDLKNTERKDKNQDRLNCFEFNIVELESVLKNAIELSKAGLLPSRIQIQVNNEVHYTALDLEFTPQGAKAAVLDAALDDKRMEIVELLKGLPFTEIYLTSGDEDEDGIQLDDNTCSFFSLHHLQKSSKRKNFFSELSSMSKIKSDGVVHEIRWKDFPIEFLKYAQEEPLDGSLQNQAIVEKISRCVQKIREFQPKIPNVDLLRIMASPSPF